MDTKQKDETLDRYWQNRMAEDNYRDMRLINREGVLSEVRENAKLRLALQKMEARQREEEAKRGIYEELAFDDDGKPYLVTRNLWIDTKPREFSNIRYPKLIYAARRSCLEECVFIIDCAVNGNTCMIYLDPKKVGSGTYLLGKFVAAGICIHAPEKRAKQYARLLVAWLLRYAEKTVIEDEPGWVEVDGKFSFVPEGSLTWREIRKLL